ncbi:hypothetical protein VF13_35450, partial [Nostoc linckia z16]
SNIEKTTAFNHTLKPFEILIFGHWAWGMGHGERGKGKGERGKGKGVWFDPSLREASLREASLREASPTPTPTPTPTTKLRTGKLTNRGKG